MMIYIYIIHRDQTPHALSLLLLVVVVVLLGFIFFESWRENFDPLHANRTHAGSALVVQSHCFEHRIGTWEYRIVTRGWKFGSVRIFGRRTCARILERL